MHVNAGNSRRKFSEKLFTTLLDKKKIPDTQKNR